MGTALAALDGFAAALMTWTFYLLAKQRLINPWDRLYRAPSNAELDISLVVTAFYVVLLAAGVRYGA